MGLTLARIMRPQFVKRQITGKTGMEAVVLIQCSILLVIEDDEQYSVARIATLCAVKTPSPKVTNSLPGMYDAFSVGAFGFPVRRVALTGVRVHPTLYCWSPLATLSQP